MLELQIKEYTDEYKDKWDDFVLNQSMNGTFLQTKQFLDYHGDRFCDASLILYKGNDTIVAVVPACTITEAGRKIFSAHRGSTFGGIVVARQFYNIEHMEAVMNVLEDYFQSNSYDEVQLKCTSDIFAEENTNLLSYFLFQRGYSSYDEISSYVNYKTYKEEIPANFTSGRRRDYNYSLKHNLTFREIGSREEIEKFYTILCENLQKFDAAPVHTLEELQEFKESRLKDIVEFYGVFYEDEMIAGSMVFCFGDRVLHTQYLAASQKHLKMFPMNFLDTNLIRVAKERGFRYFSFGTSTEDHGRVLNKHLAQFKEGFGTEYGLNRTFMKLYR